MTEPKQPATPPAADPEAARIKSIDERLAGMKDEILGAVKDMIGAGRSGEHDAQQAAQRHEAGKLDRPTQTAEGLSAMVDAAVNKVLGDKQAADADAAHRAQHEKLEAAAAEKPPVQRRGIHRAMGWGEPAE